MRIANTFRREKSYSQSVENQPIVSYKEVSKVHLAVQFVTRTSHLPTSCQSMRQPLFLLFLVTGDLRPPASGLDSRCCCFDAFSCPTAVLTANSNTSSTPFISLLLHSTYTAPICLATRCPCSGVTGVKPWVLRRSMQTRFVRRSDFRPTRMSGVVGQK